MPPVEFVDFSESEAAQRGCEPKGAKDEGAMRSGDALQRGPVEMVVVVVADEQDLNRRQIFEADAGSAVALGAGELHGTRAARPDRVGEDIEAAGLEQNRGVIDEGSAEFGPINARRRRRAGFGFDPATPGADFAVPHPFERSTKILPGHAGIEEASVAEVFDGGRRLDQGRQDVSGVGHGLLLIRMQAGGQGRNFAFAGQENVMVPLTGLQRDRFGL